jgi:hypothetical protein
MQADTHLGNFFETGVASIRNKGHMMKSQVCRRVQGVHMGHSGMETGMHLSGHGGFFLEKLCRLSGLSRLQLNIAKSAIKVLGAQQQLEALER